MVTTRKTSDSKVIAMDEKTGGAAAPPRTLLEEVNSQLMCVLCRGYYIDATTIVECLHSFCRSCIIKHLQVKSYCPICEMMINSAKPNIKPDKALQDIVYKLVPGLFQREMQRRQAFYASRPGPAASATPEQRGEDTERIIFSPEDVISFSLEYMDCSDHESASSRSSESGNESTPNEAGAPTRRYLQCPAVVNISHLKKFLSMKYDVDVSHFFVDILYKRVPLPDYYTLMDIAYIYNWKRNEPMRFFYQISDFSAIRDRFGFFGLKRPEVHDRKGEPSPPSPAPPSPAPSQLTEAGSDASSGTFSPVPDDKAQADFSNRKETHSKADIKMVADASLQDSCSNTDQASSQSSSSMDVEKSQFLNSFELTAKCELPVKCAAGSGKCSGSPTKETDSKCDLKFSLGDKFDIVTPKKAPTEKSSMSLKMEMDTSPGKRKAISSDQIVDGKKIKLTPDKKNNSVSVPKTSSDLSSKITVVDSIQPPTITVGPSSAPPCKPAFSVTNKIVTTPFLPPNAVESVTKPDKISKPVLKIPPINSGPELLNASRKSLPGVMKASPVKRKLSADTPGASTCQQLIPKSTNVSKVDPSESDVSPSAKNVDSKQRIIPISSRITSSSTILPPKMNIPSRIPNKNDNIQMQPETKKEVPKTTNLPPPRPPVKLPNAKAPKPQGDPLKSLFHSCNINIPSSLSITLTDQKEQKTHDTSSEVKESKKQSQGSSPPVSSQMQSNFPQKSTNAPEVHNYIEILKLPDTEMSTDEKNSKTVSVAKPSDATASGKGPIPNLKPISDTKQSKALAISKPQTFQQTFLQSLQQQSEKPKYIKTRLDFPKTNPAVPPKSGPEEMPISTPPTPTEPSPSVAKPTNVLGTKYKPVPMAQPIRKPIPPPTPKAVKSDSALDLSTPHTVQSQLGPQQTKALETMQSITNLAKRQSYTQRMTSPSQVFSQESFKMNTSNASPIRIPVPPPHTKHLKTNPTTRVATNSPKHFPDYFQPLKSMNARTSNNISPLHNSKTSNLQQTSASSSQTSQRSQTRSPSSSPKLVIACPSPKSQSPEDKQLMSPRGADNSSQSNLISSSQISSTNHANNESSVSKEPAKNLKSIKPQPPTNKGRVGGASSKAGTSGTGSSPSDLVHSLPSQLLAQQAYLRQQLELQTQLGLLPPGAAAQWYNNPVARAHFENIMKNMTHNPPMPFPNNHNVKDNK